MTARKKWAQLPARVRSVIVGELANKAYRWRSFAGNGWPAAETFAKRATAYELAAAALRESARRGKR